MPSQQAWCTSVASSDHEAKPLQNQMSIFGHNVRARQLTVIADTPNSGPNRGISLCAVFFPSFTPDLSFTVTGISPSALFMPTTILPSFPTASRTNARQPQTSVYNRGNLRAEPEPVLYTRSIGQPQLRSTKSRFPAHSRPMISAAGTRSVGLLPAICMPNVASDGCRRTSDHSSFEPCKKDMARPTRSGVNTSANVNVRDQRTLATGYVGTVVNA